VVAGRTDLAEHKRPYAHDHAFVGDLLAAIEAIGPTTLVGVSGMPQTFTQPVIEAMARINQRPVIFALSNPTSKAECTAEQAYQWSGGQAIFASGSPFDEVTLNGTTFVPGQANNSYIFPGVGLGVVASEARLVTDEMFFAAAKALAEKVSADDLKTGCLYPPLSRIREVSLAIATEVAEIAFQQNLAGIPRPSNLTAYIQSQMYLPEY
jgi:malate dehydrogenase (oxaloacetate-decarboxylating)(NADP+)